MKFHLIFFLRKNKNEDTTDCNEQEGGVSWIFTEFFWFWMALHNVYTATTLTEQIMTHSKQKINNEVL